MPLDEEFGPQIYSSNADLCNVSAVVIVLRSRTYGLIVSFGIWQTGGRPAGSCTAALFLKAFVDGIEAKDGKEAPLRWAHIDIAGSMEVSENFQLCSGCCV